MRLSGISLNQWDSIVSLSRNDYSFPEANRIWALPIFTQVRRRLIHNTSYAYVFIYDDGTFYGEVCKSDTTSGFASLSAILLLSDIVCGKGDQ